MNKTFLYIAFTILFHSVGFSQNKQEILEFYSLILIERVTNNDEIKSLVKADSLGKKDFFFTENYKGNEGLIFIKK